MSEIAMVTSVWRRSCPSIQRKIVNCSTMPSSATTTKVAIRLKTQLPVQLRDLVADIAAEQIERAVREVDVAHQAEDQREAARHQEIEAAERDAVEQRAEEDALAAEHLLELRRPDREDQEQQDRDHDHDDERPDRVTADEAVHDATSRDARGAAHARRDRHGPSMAFDFLRVAVRHACDRPLHA